MAARIRKDDLVIVRSGNERGKTGKVLSVLPDKQRVVVEGVNVVWKHIKPTQQNRKGGRIQKPAPIHVSKVQPIDPETGRGTRVKIGYRDGLKVRTSSKGKELSVVGKA
jgi:large subunit ribosomal protein L24